MTYNCEIVLILVRYWLISTVLILVRYWFITVRYCPDSGEILAYNCEIVLILVRYWLIIISFIRTCIKTHTFQLVKKIKKKKKKRKIHAFKKWLR